MLKNAAHSRCANCSKIDDHSAQKLLTKHNMVEDGDCREGASDVSACLRRHAAEIGGGPSMGTMEGERQHMYEVRMGSFPCAWSREGADAMARLRSWVRSGLALPARTREGSLSRGRRERRDGRLAALVVSRGGSRAQSEGKGWKHPLAGSMAALGSGVRSRASGGGILRR